MNQSFIPNIACNEIEPDKGAKISKRNTPFDSRFHHFPEPQFLINFMGQQDSATIRVAWILTDTKKSSETVVTRPANKSIPSVFEPQPSLFKDTLFSDILAR